MAPSASPLDAGLTAGRTGEFRPTPRPARTGRGGARPVRLGRLEGAPAKEVSALVRTAPVVCVLDRSGSMYGVAGDPNDIAGAVIESLLDAMDRAGEGRAAFAAFGSNAPAEYATGLLGIRKSKRQLVAAARTGPGLGGTNVASGLERAAEALKGIRPGETPVVYLVTDGGFADVAAGRSVLSRMPDACVHVLLIGTCGEVADGIGQQLIADGFGSVTPINHLDVAELANQVWTIFGRTLGLGATPAPIRTNRKRTS